MVHDKRALALLVEVLHIEQSGQRRRNSGRSERESGGGRTATGDDFERRRLDRYVTIKATAERGPTHQHSLSSCARDGLESLVSHIWRRGKNSPRVNGHL